MTKQEYMNQLKEKLNVFDNKLAQEILDDYEGHFRDGKANGRSEEEICEELGNIDEMVEELKQLYEPKHKQENSFNSTVNEVVNDAINIASNIAGTIMKGIKSGIDAGKKTVYTERPKDDVVDAERTKETAEDCRRVVIEAGCADVNIKRSEDSGFHLEYINHGSMKDKMIYHFYGEQKGDTYYGRVVKEEGKSSLFQKVISPEIEINITIPDNFECAEIHTASGDIKVEELKIKEARLYSASGDVTSKNMDCARYLLESTSGDIVINTAKGTALTVNAKSGDIMLESCLFETAEIRSSSGDIRGKEIHILNYEANTASGDIRFEKLTTDMIHVSSKSGDIELQESTTKESRAESVSGDVKIENTVSEKINISSVSGDAVIKARANNYQAQSTSGDVIIEAEGNMTGSFQTVSGDIDIAIDNQSGGYAAELNVMNGDIDLIFGQEHRSGCNRGTYTMGSGASRITINSMSGDIKIRG